MISHKTTTFCGWSFKPEVVIHVPAPGSSVPFLLGATTSTPIASPSLCCSVWLPVPGKLAWPLSFSIPTFTTRAFSFYSAIYCGLLVANSLSCALYSPSSVPKFLSLHAAYIDCLCHSFSFAAHGPFLTWALPWSVHANSQFGPRPLPPALTLG